MEFTIFKNIIEKSFLFLIQDYNFNTLGVNETSRDFSVDYLKGDLIVELKYNFPNKYFQIKIYNKVSETNKIYHSRDCSIDLDWLIINYEPVNYESIINRKFETVNEMIEYKAQLLKKYGKTILLQKEWFSWGDVESKR